MTGLAESLMSMAAWKDLQKSNPDLRRSHALLRKGKTPHKKEKNVADVRIYTRECVLNEDGLVVKRKVFPPQSIASKLIVIPRNSAFTMASELHKMWEHPNHIQMVKRFERKFFTPDANKVLPSVWQLGHSISDQSAPDLMSRTHPDFWPK